MILTREMLALALLAVSLSTLATLERRTDAETTLTIITTVQYIDLVIFSRILSCPTISRGFSGNNFTAHVNRPGEDSFIMKQDY